MADSGEKDFILGGNPANNVMTNAVERFNTYDKTWTAIATTIVRQKGYFNTAMELQGSSDQSVIVMTDGYWSGPPATYYHETEAFDTSTETCASKAASPHGSATRMGNIQGAHTGKTGLQSGGQQADASTMDEQYEYRLLQDSWITFNSLYAAVKEGTNSRYYYDTDYNTGRFLLFYGRSGNPASIRNKLYDIELYYGTQKYIGAKNYTGYRNSAITGPDGPLCTAGRIATGTDDGLEHVDVDSLTFTTKQDMTAKRDSGGITQNEVAGDAPYNNDEYYEFFGGYTSVDANRHNDVYIYRYSTNTWAALGATMNTANMVFAYGSNRRAKTWKQLSDLKFGFLDDEVFHNIYQSGAGYVWPSLTMAEEDGEWHLLGGSGTGCGGLAGYSREHMGYHASHECIYYEDGDTWWSMWRKTADSTLHLFKSSNRKDWSLVWSADWDNDSSCTYSFEISNQYLYIACNTMNTEPLATRGINIVKFNLATEAKVSTLHVHDDSDTDVCLSIDRNNTNNMVVTYNSVGRLYKYSTDGGSTWSAEKNMSSTEKPPEESTRSYAGNSFVHCWNEPANAIYGVFGNDAPGEDYLDVLYYSFVDNYWHNVEKKKRNMVKLVDIAIDQNNGDIYIGHMYGLHDNQYWFEVWMLDYSDSWSWTGLSHNQTAVYVGMGQPRFGMAWSESVWTFWGYQVMIGDLADGARFQWDGWFPEYSGEGSFFWGESFIPGYDFLQIKNSDNNLSMDDHQPLVFNYLWPYGNPYYSEDDTPAGPAILIYKNLIDKTTRRPLTGKTVVLKDHATGSTVVTMTEHSTYPGLYYGSFHTQFVRFVDVFVDGVEATYFGPIALVPSDKYPKYRS